MINEKKMRKILKKWFKDEEITMYFETCNDLKYPDLIEKYETFVLTDDIWKVIPQSSIKTTVLLNSLLKLKNPNRHQLAHSFVIMSLQEEAEIKTANRYKEAIENSDEKELEDIFVNYDTNGEFRRNYIQSME